MLCSYAGAREEAEYPNVRDGAVPPRKALLCRHRGKKEGAERRLAEVSLQYQSFAKQSKNLMEEMEKFRKASMSDALTGVFNRRAYELHIKKALESLKN